MVRKYWPLVWGALMRKKTRTLLTLAALTLAFMLVGLLQAVNAVISGGADFLGANRMIVQARNSFTTPLPMRLLPQIESVPGVQFVNHSQWFGGTYGERRDFFAQFAVNPRRLFDTYPEWVLPAEQRRAFIATQDGAIVGRLLAEKFGWRVGDIVPINSGIWTHPDGSRNWEWRIVGIFDGRDPEWQKRANLMYLNYAQFDEGRVAGARGLAGVFVVRVADPLQAAKVGAAIDAKFANSSDETKTQSEQEFQLGFLKQIGDIGMILNAICGAVFFTILILTGYTMSQAVRDRIPELAVLKCLGFTDRAVLALVLAESLLLCAIGAIAGMMLATIIPPLALPPEFPVRADAGVWGFAGIAVLVLTLAVGLPPAIHAMRIKIVDALAGR
jgi:putative ABC transport system permease protein